MGVVGTGFGQIAVQTRAGSGPEVGFAETTVDLLEARFWLTNGLPTTRELSDEVGASPVSQPILLS